MPLYKYASWFHCFFISKSIRNLLKRNGHFPKVTYRFSNRFIKHNSITINILDTAYLASYKKVRFKTEGHYLLKFFYIRIKTSFIPFFFTQFNTKPTLSLGKNSLLTHLQDTGDQFSGITEDIIAKLPYYFGKGSGKNLRDRFRIFGYWRNSTKIRLKFYNYLFIKSILIKVHLHKKQY